MISSSRRRWVAGALVWPLVLREGFAQAPTPACGRPTEPQTEGPFYKPSSPKRSSLLERDSAANLLAVGGLVLSPGCKPVANALLDFWHADEFGAYDQAGFRYRGHQATDALGRWRLETILPAEYTGRARHIHVRVQAPGGRLLTTQLYFPESLGHHRDGLYSPALEMKLAGKGERYEGSFDFVV